MPKADVVREFYTALHDHDWERLAATMTDDVVRIGMQDTEADTCRGKARYLEFVQSVIGRFDHHTMKIVQVFYSADGLHASAETIEEIRPPGGEMTTFHCLKAIEINEAGLITSFNLFQKAPAVPPPPWITVAAIESGLSAE